MFNDIKELDTKDYLQIQYNLYFLLKNNLLKKDILWYFMWQWKEVRYLYLTEKLKNDIKIIFDLVYENELAVVSDLFLLQGIINIKEK